MARYRRGQLQQHGLSLCCGREALKSFALEIGELEMRAEFVRRTIFVSAFIVFTLLLSFYSSMSIEGMTSRQDPNATLPSTKKTAPAKKTTPPPKKSAPPARTSRTGASKPAGKNEPEVAKASAAEVAFWE